MAPATTLNKDRTSSMTRRLVGVSVLGIALALAPTVLAQAQTSSQTSTGRASDSDSTRPATTTTSGTTGIWFVPTGEVLPARQWSVSFYRTNIDDGQGFSDVSTFPATFAYGLGNRAELFGSWATVVRIDRDTRPLFFPSTEGGADAGTGGGILVDYPLVRQQWLGNKRGDFTVGGKVNLLATTQAPVALAVRGMVKLPAGDKDSGASTGKADFQVDGILSTSNAVAELSGYTGVIVRGNPSGYTLTNGLRWGVGAAFPQRYNLGFRLSAELFGEHYFNNTITAPAGQFGSDGSAVPVSTVLRSPAIASIGLTWQAPNGFFIGGAASWNLHMKNRDDAQCAPGTVCAGSTFPSTPKDDKGLQIRIGFHPGVRRAAVASTAPTTTQAPTTPAPATPAPAAPPAQAQNRPPTVKAACDPCTVEVGRTSTISADAQDPDGDPLTYQWTTQAGTVASPTTRQSLWTAPGQPGPVPVRVGVNDGRGGTASDGITIQVVQPRQFTFEDVHFEFDRYTLRPDALKILDDAVTAMQANPALKLTIEGHTCNIGTAEYNLALGERRAKAVRDYLASRGIGGDRLRTVSYGEEKPQYDNSREETRRLNRRAALVVVMQ
jgi:outer membrane protein OmpA-like peptidoglycan-associated protein